MTGITQSAPAGARRVPPGPRGHWLTGVIADFRRDPLAYVLDVTRTYGDVVRLRFGPAESWLLNDPELIKRVLQENNKNYKRNDFLINILKIVSDENLFTSNGDFWLRQRRLMQPAFHRQHIAGFGQIMVEQAQRALARWERLPPGQTLKVDEEMIAITLGTVGRALFGVDLSEEASVFGPAFTTSAAYFNYRLNHLFYVPLFIPNRRNREFKQAVRTVNQHIEALIQARRRSGEVKADPSTGFIPRAPAVSTAGAQPVQAADAGHGHDPSTSSRHDLLSMLMEARDEETGATMSDEQVRNEAGTMIFAGHETTGNTLTWAFYLLSQNPTAGETVQGGSVVRLNASVGTKRPLLTVPNVTGTNDEISARATLARTFTVRAVYRTATSPALRGAVVGQLPKPGVKVKRWAQIIIYVSR